jgi:hypothetical protein
MLKFTPLILITLIEKIFLTNFIVFIIYKYLMSKSAVKMTGRLAGFDPSAYANEFVTTD